MVWESSVGSRLARLAAVAVAFSFMVALASCDTLDPVPETDRFGKVGSEIRKTLEERARKLSYKKPDKKPEDGDTADKAGWGPIVVGQQAGKQDLFEGLDEKPLDIQLRFRGADIKQVATTILGDLLAVEYSMDPALTGPIDLETGRGISPRSLITLLADALDRVGGQLEKEGGLYRLRFKELGGEQRLPGVGGEVTFVPVLKTGAEQIKGILEKVFPERTAVIVDEARNRLILQGTEASRRQMANAIRQFDTDILAGKRVAILPVRKAEARNVLNELLRITADGRNENPVRLSLITRMNGILVIAPTQDQVDRIWDLVKDLDRVPAGGQQLHVIELQHTTASEIAALLSKTISPDAEISVVEGPAEGGKAAAPGAQVTAKEAAGKTAAPKPKRAGPSGLRIVAHASANTLLVYGSAEQFAVVERAVAKLDVPAPQVLIEATILEVSLNDQLTFGVQGFLQKDKGTRRAGFFGGTAESVAGTFPGFNFIFRSQGDVRAVINALKTVTDVTILSSPQVVTVNHGQASLEVGDEVPLLVREVEDTTDPNAPTVSEVQYRQTGVILKVTPHINKDSLVTLDIVQEVTSVPSSTTVNLTPTLSRRIIQTRASVRSGQPIALGGLVSEQVTETRQRTPVLGQLPILGPLFGTTDTALDRTELLVILTPTVFTSGDEANAISLELLDRLRSVKDEMIKDDHLSDR